MDRFHLITEGTNGRANVDLMEKLGYQYITIGNNEGITFAKEDLSALYKQTSLKVLVNNLYDTDGVRPSWAQPFAIHEIDGVRLGFIGTTVKFSPFYEMLGWTIHDPFEEVAQSVKAIRDKVDIVVLMSHLGFPRDEKLAQQIDGIDLILGAHTHQVLEDGVKVNNTWIHQVGKFGRYVGHAVLKGKTNCKYENCFSLEYIQLQMEASANYDACQETVKVLHDWQLRAKAHLAEPVITLNEQLMIDWYEETPLSNVLAEGLRQWCEAQISIVNAGQILDNLQKGEVTKEHIHQICPHPINPCIVHLTGEQLWSILNQSLCRDLQEMKIKGYGFRGERLGMMAVDGLIVQCETHTKRKNQQTIKQIWFEEAPLNLAKTYKVATIDMFTFSSLFDELKGIQNTTYFMPEFIRDVLAERLKKGRLETAIEKRWIHTNESREE